MQIEQIRQVVTEAWTNNRCLRLVKYFSSTTDTMSTMVIRLGGLSGYRQAVDEQLKKPNFELSVETQQKLKEYNVSVEAYNKGVTYTLERWRDMVRDEDSRPQARSGQDKIVPHPSGAYWETVDGEPKVGILNAFKLSEEIIHPGRLQYNPAKDSPREDVRAKNIFLQTTFMRDYIGRINLTPGKVETIELV